MMMYPSSPYHPPNSYVSQLLMETTDMDPYGNNNNNNNSSNNSSRTGSFSIESPPYMVGCCGSPQSMCQPSDNGGESVVITIAPLSPTTKLPSSDNVRTRIVTCYCAGNCTCPGCLVHPGNVLVGDPLMDPYGFSMDPATFCPSSTASSIYSTSDDEDQQSPYPLLR
ncbi:hypothetical protein BC941DRAFT_415326 [Chlamydoabsidia padenii]|nr:hypothetical protein BC941DRAFT_415326 [Chlamydoabsidia padenii]